ncbi:MAG: vanadium-dependent haloperoxidase [Rubrivivax sp.]|nr:vanadium-dependent haloperoxidase [Rubrivivax sp.]
MDPKSECAQGLATHRSGRIGARARRTARSLGAGAALAVLAASSCGGGDDETDPYEADSGAPKTINSASADAVSAWTDVASATINGTGTAVVTPEEQRPAYAFDLATVHLAIYDALMAITGTHLPYASAAQPAQTGASQEAAAAAAAYRVLQALFPNRAALYQGAYDSAVAAIADGDAKTRGLAIGTAAANAVLTLRLNDGRAVLLAAYVPGTAAGQFRGTNPVGLFNPYVRPFVLQHAAQFRPAGPPAMTSAAYETALAETRAAGSSASTTRSAEQTDTARFHTDAPPRFWPRNVKSFYSNQATLGESARLAAMLWVAQADATIACFEAKYFYNAWRPTSAITLADTDGNANTAPDATWTPVVPTPNHPEYPAAHGCNAGAVAEVVRVHYRTRQVSFAFDSTAAGVVTTRHNFTSTTAMVEDLQMARIWGGMHFRYSNDDGAALGKNVAKWIVTQRFQPR